MSTSSSAQQLHEAILQRNVNEVKRLLHDGVDPNESPELPSKYVRNDLCTFITKADETAETQVAPLHVAVARSSRRGIDFGEVIRVGEVIRMLLDAGARTEMTSYNICILDVCIPRMLTPLDLALFLKQTYQSKPLDAAIGIIHQASIAYKSNNPPTEPVPQSVVSMLKNLLLSEKLSDCHFVCSDGKTLHAHRCVLAAASPYFSAYFEGPWGDQQKHRDGQWETANSSKVMTAVLSFVYTGQVDDCIIKSNELAILSAASEYDLPALMDLCVRVCTQQLNKTNFQSYLQVAYFYDLDLLKKKCIGSLAQYLNETSVKGILQLAHHQGLDEIKDRCFDFIRENAALVLTDRDMIALANEEPELWDQMTRAVSPAKRQRQDS